MNAHAEGAAAPPTERDTLRYLGLVRQTEHWYRQHRAQEDVRNLAYYRGQFWAGDGINITDAETHDYRAQQNEIFPICDTVVSSLAMDVPAVEPMDLRYWSTESPTRERDLTISGRRLAAVLNHWAVEDELDQTVQELVLHGQAFGWGIVKTSWSPILGRVIWRTRLPWEWHCDPGAKRARDISWCFERFVIHVEDLRARLDGDAYIPIRKGIKADTYPRSLVEDYVTESDEAKLRAEGLREYVSMVEFWDFRRREILHIHPETQQVLLQVPMGYGRPYDVLVFHDSIGRVRGLSDITMLAPAQRDINEMVSGRREIVRRLMPRTLMDRSLWRTPEEFERYKNSKTWEPQLVDFPADGNISGRIWTSEQPPLSFDFKDHLNSAVDSEHWIAGLADYQRGEVTNIRTAAEASMVRGSVEGRMHIRTAKLKRVVSNMFSRALEVWRWAAANPKASAIDMASIANLTQGDVDETVLANDLEQHSPKFRLLPFSPLMEDKYTRRGQLLEIMQALVSPSPLAVAINPYELGREIAEQFGLRPSIVLPEPPPQAAPLAGTDEAGGVPMQLPMPGAVPPELAVAPLTGA
jgi:hypothetical protein